MQNYSLYFHGYNFNMYREEERGEGREGRKQGDEKVEREGNKEMRR